MDAKPKADWEELFGYAAALGLIGAGLILYRWYPEGFGGGTKWVASGLMLTGGVGLAVELDGSGWTGIDFLSLATGLVVLLPSIVGSRYVYGHWTGVELWGAMAVFCLLWVLGIAGIAVTILGAGRSIVNAAGQETMVNVLAQIAALVTALASILAAARSVLTA